MSKRILAQLELLNKKYQNFFSPQRAGCKWANSNGTVAKCPKRPNPRQPHHREDFQNFSKKAISQQSPNGHCRDVPAGRLLGRIGGLKFSTNPT